MQEVPQGLDVLPDGRLALCIRARRRGCCRQRFRGRSVVGLGRGSRVEFAAQRPLDQAKEIPRRMADGRLPAPLCPLLQDRLAQDFRELLKGCKSRRALFRRQPFEPVGHRVRWGRARARYSTYTVFIYRSWTYCTYSTVFLRIPKMAQMPCFGFRRRCCRHSRSQGIGDVLRPHCI